jgi:hypothetical protein
MFSAVWWFVSISILVTLVHTIDEVVSNGGPIWDYLIDLLPGAVQPPEMVVFVGYLLFQSLNCGLAVAGGLRHEWAWFALAGIRIFDIGFTHTFLPKIRSPNPGHTTRLLLLFDVVFCGWLYCECGK